MRIFNLNNCLKVLFVAFFVVSIAALSHGATTSGTLTENETWSGIVELTGDVTVPVGVTLEIEDGTEVIFPANSDDTGGGDEAELTELIINGSLSAVGTESNKIVFKSGAFIDEKGDWGGIRATWGLGSKTLDMQHCVISHASTGIRWHVQGGVQSATISNCTVEKTSGIGIYVFGESGADISIAIDNNSILDNDSHGIYTYVNGASSTLGGTINGNTITDSGGFGVIAYAYTNAVSTVTVNDNDISNSGHAGVYVYGYDFGQANITISNSTISNSGTDTGSSYRHGVYVYANSHGVSDVDILNNTVTGSGTHGIYAYTYNNATAAIDMDDNTVTGNGSYGIYSYTYSSSVCTGSISGNEVHDNGSNGIYVYSNANYTTARCEFVVNGNTVYSNNNTTGIYCRSNYSGLKVDVTGNEVYGSSNGIYCHGFGYNNTQYVFDALISDNYIHDNTGTGIYCYEDYRGQFYPEIRSNIVTGNSGDGIFITRNTGQTNTVEPVISLNSVHENGNHGIYCQATEFTKVIFNNIYLNTNYDLYNATAYPVDGRFNFWGSGTTAEMESEDPFINIQRIYDTFDDIGMGLVNYCECLPFTSRICRICRRSSLGLKL